MTQKIYHINNIILSSSKNFLLKNTFKVTLQHLLNVFVLFNTVSFIEINLKLKIDPKMFTFKNLEEIWKTWKKFRKNEWQPCKYEQFNKKVCNIFIYVKILHLKF